MAKRKRKKSGSNVKKVAAVGAGMALVAAAAAGAYFLYGTKEGARKRKQIKGWTLRVKGEVLEKMEKLKDVNEKVYRETVDTVAEKYRKIKNIDSEELDAVVKELKNHWKNIHQHIGGPKLKRRKRRPPVKKTAKRTARKRATKKSRK